MIFYCAAPAQEVHQHPLLESHTWISAVQSEMPRQSLLINFFSCSSRAHAFFWSWVLRPFRQLEASKVNSSTPQASCTWACLSVCLDKEASLAPMQTCFAPVRPCFAPVQQGFDPHRYNTTPFAPLSYRLWESLRGHNTWEGAFGSKVDRLSLCPSWPPGATVKTRNCLNFTTLAEITAK